MTQFAERFTRDVDSIFAEASGLGDDMLVPDVESSLIRSDTALAQSGDEALIRSNTALSQDEGTKIQLGPLFALMGGALILFLLLAARPSPRRFEERF